MRGEGGDDMILSAGEGSTPHVGLVRVARGPMRNNNYLIVDPLTRDAVLVDPAWEAGKLHAALASSGSHLRGILVTHAHFDHIDLARPLADFYGCPIWMSRPEIESSGFSAAQLEAIDVPRWRIGSLTVEAIPTPGHTPGSTCFLAGDALFSGDVLFAEGCGICNGVEAAEQMFDSIELLKRRMRPGTRIYPGHTYVKPPGQTFSDVLTFNPYLHFRDREAFAAFRLRRGQSQRSLMNFA